jgi:hypothetical protein
MLYVRRAIAQAVIRRLPTMAAEVEPRSGHVGFVVDRVALGQVFCEYFGFPCQFSFHGLLQNQTFINPGWYNRPTQQVDCLAPLQQIN